jgi:predicted permease
VFSLLNAVVLKPLPVHQPTQLVSLRSPSFSYPVFEEVRRHGTAVFEGVFGWDMQRLNAGWSDGTTRADVLAVTSEFYEVLRLRPAAGRLLGPQDSGAVAVISYACWERRFASSPHAIGSKVRIERALYTIVGVAPRSFYGVAPGLAPEITIPAASLPLTKPSERDVLKTPTSAWLHIMARLRPGVEREQANTALQAFWPRVLEVTVHPGMRPERRTMYLSRQTALDSAATGFSRVRNQFRRPLTIVLGLVVLLLLVACATVGNLLLVRSEARKREIGVQVALGASRGRIALQFLTEAMLLAAAGGACGLLFAMWGSHALTAMLSTAYQPIVLSLTLDFRVLLFVIGLSALAATLFAMLPAIGAVRVDATASLRAARTAGRERRSGIARGSVSAQVALCVLLLAGAALFWSSLRYVLSADAGFERRNLIVLAADAESSGRDGAALRTYYSQLLHTLRSMPGVEAASLSFAPPLSNEMGLWTQMVTVDGAPGQNTQTYFNAVSPGYFGATGTALVRGRDFRESDGPAAPRVVVVNEAFARTYLGDLDPLGHRVGVGRDESRQDLEIIGIVQDAKYQRLQDPARPTAYLPLRQAEALGDSNLVAEIRTAGRPETLLEPIRRAVTEIDTSVPVRIETMQDRIRDSLVRERALAAVAGFLGAAALLLAAMGLYGMISYAVARRTPEIGVRIALGASRAGVVWMAMREAALLTTAGLLAGLAAAVASGQLIESLLHGVRPAEPSALIVASAIVAAAAFVAVFVPAWQASRIDPAVALRQE